MPLAATVAAAIACNAGCGNSVSVIMDRFGATNQTSVCQIADRIRTQAWLWEGDAPLCADRTAERCTHTHTHAGLELGLGLESVSELGLVLGLVLGLG